MVTVRRVGRRCKKGRDGKRIKGYRKMLPKRSLFDVGEIAFVAEQVVSGETGVTASVTCFSKHEDGSMGHP